MLAFRLRHFPLWLAIAAASIVCCCWQAVETAETDQHRSHKHRADHHLHKSDLKRNKVLKKAIGKLLRSGVHYYSPDQLRDFKYFLSSISIPRSVNSKGHRHVRKFIKTTIGSLSPNWHVEEDSFATEAAGGLGSGGKVRFRNIVATYIPSSYLCSGLLGANETDHQQPQQQQQQQRIVLSCHYDSLHPSLVHGGGGGGGDYSRNGRGSFSKSRGGRQFVGATDAAVSCSILLSLAQYITPYLALVTKHKPKHNHKPPPTVQLIFFDGEEALLDENHGKNFHRARSLRSSVSSNSRNALYGSRHLAREWELEAANVQNSTTANSTQSSKKRKKKRSRQLSAETSSIFKSAAKLAATAEQLCKLSSAINSRPRDNYRSRRSTENDGDDEDESASSLSAEANEVVPRGEHEDAAAAAAVGGGDDDEVIDSVVSSSARRHRLVVTDLDSSNDVESNHQSVQGGAGISQLALIEGASRLLAGNYHSLANIRLLLLLDLIGGPQAPRFFNTNPLTSRYFRQLAEIEKHLLASTSSKSKLDFDEVDDPRSRKKKTFAKPFFQTNPPFVLSLVRDDHLPFVVRNVPVVHLIPSPFPRNWHTAEDNLRSLNYDAIGRITRTLQIFLLHSLKV